MKRFVCALIILTITLSSSAIINKKVINSADIIIEMLENNSNFKTIIEKWENDKFLYSLIFTQSDIEEIQLLFDELKENNEDSYKNIKDKIIRLSDSLILNIENIF